MKKSIIAAGAASVALAAMPIVGVFAAGVDGVKDDINAAVSSGCTISNTADQTDTNYAHNTVNLSVAPGETSQAAASAGVTVTCNGAWTASAVGSTTGTNITSLYYSGNEIATGTDTSGATSKWAFKIASASGTVSGGASVSIDDDYSDWAEIPGTADAVVTSSAASTSTIIPNYRVYAATTQTPGTYIGQVTYTVATNNS